MTRRIDGQTDEQAVGGAVNLGKLSPEDPIAQTVPRIRIVLPAFVDKSATKSCVHRGRALN